VSENIHQHLQAWNFICFSFPGWYCGQCHKRGSCN